MRFDTWLGCAAVGLAIGVTGCSDSGKEKATDPDKASMAVAEALTSGVEFKDGVFKKGAIPEATADDVEISQNDPPLELSPGEQSLMSLEVDNPDQDDDPVVATLIQFQGSSDHVEVGVGDDADGGVLDGGVSEDGIATSFTLDNGICDGFCNKKFPIKMFQAIKLKGGKVSKRIERTFTLDCRKDGDADKCEKQDSGGKGKTDAGSSTDDGDDGKTVDTSGASATLAGGFVFFDRAKCITCDGLTKPYCAMAPFPEPVVTCVTSVVDDNGDDDAVVGWANCVAAGLSGVNGNGGAAASCKASCNDTACSPAAFNTASDACSDLPAAVQADIDACMVVPDAGTSP